MNSTVICAALLVAAGFGSPASAADSPGAPEKDPIARSASYAVPAADRQEAATVEPSTESASKPDLHFALRTPEERFADAPMPVEMRAIHYDQTPNGIPANVSTLGFIQKF